MKKLLLIVLLSIVSILSKAQTGGFVTINDFGLPNYPYQFTRFWLRGSTPAGTNPIMEFYGLSNIKMFTDTVTIPKLALREDASPNKLVWIDANGMLRAFTPNYLTSVSSLAVTTALGYTPIPNTRSLTINGTAFDLSADRSWIVGDVSTASSYSNPTWITSLAQSKITYSGTTAQYVRGDGSLATFPTVGTGSVTSVAASIPAGAISVGGSPITNAGTLAFTYNGSTAQYVRGDGSLATFPTIPAAQVNSDWNSSSGLSQILNKPTIPAAQVNSDWNAASGLAQILNKPTLLAYRHNAVVATGPIVETFSGTVAGGAGNVTFNLTADGTASGTALYTNVNYIVPFVNDASTNYTYAYTVSGDKKTVTINVKSTPAINVALLSLTLLGVPANVANGTTVTAIIVGN